MCAFEAPEDLLHSKCVIGLPKQHSVINKELWQVGIPQSSNKNHILTEVGVTSL